ncbi:MAG: hypothetical protein QE285_06050 [Aquabacterium sp.]|nr:hypothetical protein [Aquabacterium sp.]
MPSKKFELVRQLESKLDNQRKASGVPGRFAEAAALPDRKAQRKADAAAGLVPFACKLPAPLAQQLRDRAASHDGGINGLVADLLTRGLA